MSSQWTDKDAMSGDGKDEATTTVHVVDGQQAPELQTQRHLKSRHMSMIAIGGAIGTGLIIGSGGSLARSGPGSLFVAYLVVGLACLGTMSALGEMSTKFPDKRGFAGHASRCIDHAYGLTTAVVYLCKYLIVSPSQITAFALIIQYWNTSINPGVWVTLLIVFVVVVNVFGVKWFGEIEFWLSLVKIVALSGLILLCFVIAMGGSPSGDTIGFRYWKHGKAFKEYKSDGSLGQFLGFVNALVLALFAFMGCEIVGVTVGEAENPRKTVPSAIRKTYGRIAFFYIFGVFCAGLAVDSSSALLAQANKKGTAGGAAASPFVVAAIAANIKVIPDIANAALLIFTISAANADQYIASRCLYGMALDGNAPKIFAKCNSRGVPWVAFCFTGPFMLLAYLVVSSGALTIFNYFSSTITIFGGLTWMNILASHVGFMRAMKAQGIPRDTLPWKSPFQPYLTYYSLTLTVLICFFKGFDSFMPFNYKSFITHYIGIPVFGLAYAFFKVFRHDHTPSPMEIDLVTGAREFDEEGVETDYESKSWVQRVKARVLSRA